MAASAVSTFKPSTRAQHRVRGAESRPVKRLRAHAATTVLNLLSWHTFCDGGGRSRAVHAPSFRDRRPPTARCAPVGGGGGVGGPRRPRAQGPQLPLAGFRGALARRRLA